MHPLIQHVRRPIWALMLLMWTMIFVVACASGQTAPAAAPPSGGSSSSTAPVVTVRDNSFGPQTLTVKAGTTVTWEWASTANPHSVVGRFAGQAIDSGRHTGSDRFAFTFPSAGTFDYQCGVHGASMAGKVIVE